MLTYKAHSVEHSSVKNVDALADYHADYNFNALFYELRINLAFSWSEVREYSEIHSQDKF